ncbi:MAG: hypothetical protein ABII12_09595 [Planctomycetota bacterium]
MKHTHLIKKHASRGLQWGLPRLRLVTILSVVAPLVLTAGCENVDWNWDLAWWQRPKRVVRPTQGRRPAPPAQTTQPAEPTPPVRGPSDTPPPGGVPVATDTRAPQVRSPDQTGRVEEGLKWNLRPFYHLYLISDKAEEQVRHGDVCIELKNLDAKTCATLLDMLYVPMGRLGSGDECYLIFEDPGEFEAAVQFTPTLDIVPPGEGEAAVGAPASLRSGIGLFGQIIRQGVEVDRSLVDQCEQQLTLALQSMRLSGLKRWAAGILAGRLVSEYRYDYETARSYYRQAEQAAAVMPVEKATAAWWVADSFVQEGNNAKAMEVYRRILADAESARPNSHIVRRSRERLVEFRKE